MIDIKSIVNLILSKYIYIYIYISLPIKANAVSTLIFSKKCFVFQNVCSGKLCYFLMFDNNLKMR